MCSWPHFFRFWRLRFVSVARYTFYEVGGCQAPCFPPNFPSVVPSPRHTSTEPPERAPQQQGARVGGVCPDVSIVKEPRSISTTTVAITPVRVCAAGGFPHVEPFGSDAPSIRGNAWTASHTQNVMQEAWRRGPPSHPRSPLEDPVYSTGPRTSSCARSDSAPRGLSRYATWPFTIAPSGTAPVST